MSEPGDTAEADEAIRPGLEKSPDAFRTISEVSQALDVPQHVLRFWEGKFAQIRPLKRGGGRRYYRPDDVDLLRGIQSLLYGDGYTIKGVQKLLRENGAKFVVAAGRRRAEPAKAKAATSPKPAPPSLETDAPLSPAVPVSTPQVVEVIPGMPAPVLPPADPEPKAPNEPDNSGLKTPAARREAAARLLSHLKAMRRDYDLRLQAAKNGRAR